MTLQHDIMGPDALSPNLAAYLDIMRHTVTLQHDRTKRITNLAALRDVMLQNITLRQDHAYRHLAAKSHSSQPCGYTTCVCYETLRLNVMIYYATLRQIRTIRSVTLRHVKTPRRGTLRHVHSGHYLAAGRVIPKRDKTLISSVETTIGGSKWKLRKTVC